MRLSRRALAALLRVLAAGLNELADWLCEPAPDAGLDAQG